jgi:hypothetical protein
VLKKLYKFQHVNVTPLWHGYFIFLWGKKYFVGDLPIHLVVLLVIDVAERMDSFQGEKEGINYG